MSGPDVREAVRRITPRDVGLPDVGGPRTRCPWHDGRGRNFAVMRAAGGGWRWHCWSRCGAGDELAAVAIRAGIARPGERLSGPTWAATVAEAFRLAGIDGGAPRMPLSGAEGAPGGAGAAPPAPDADLAAEAAERALQAAERQRRDQAVVAALWAASAPPRGTPAARHLARRGLWPEDAEAWPPRIGWLPRAVVAEHWRSPPAGAAGCLAWALTPSDPDGGASRALQLDALGGDGSPTDPRWRRNVGPSGGHLWRCEWPDALGSLGSPDDPVVVAEGPASALAALVLRSAGEAIATMGALGLSRGDWARAIAPGRAVLVEPDGDATGEAAAHAGIREARALGLRAECTTWERIDGRDAADELAAIARRREGNA